MQSRTAPSKREGEGERRLRQVLQTKLNKRRVGLRSIRKNCKKAKMILRMFLALYIRWCRRHNFEWQNVVWKVVYRKLYSFMFPSMIELQHYHAIIFPTFHFSDDDLPRWFNYSNMYEQNRLIKLCKIIELMLLYWKLLPIAERIIVLKIYSCIIESEEKCPIFMFDSSIDWL